MSIWNIHPLLLQEESIPVRKGQTLVLCEARYREFLLRGERLEGLREPLAKNHYIAHVLDTEELELMPTEVERQMHKAMCASLMATLERKMGDACPQVMFLFTDIDPCYRKQPQSIGSIYGRCYYPSENTAIDYGEQDGLEHVDPRDYEEEPLTRLEALARDTCQYTVLISTKGLNEPLPMLADTLAHELAHVWVHVEEPSVAKYRPHGAEWKEKAKLLGLRDAKAITKRVTRPKPETAFRNGMRWACLDSEGLCALTWARRPKYTMYNLRSDPKGTPPMKVIRLDDPDEVTIDSLGDW